LSNGGIVDLTWDNAENNNRSGVFRTLTIDQLTGDGGIFKVNTDLANNKADEITLGSGSTSTKVGIDVAYDPYLATSGLAAGSSISGNALVLTDNSQKLTSVTGVADSYNLYDYTPTITDNGNNTYSVTSLAITNVRPEPTPEPTPGKQTITSPSRPMRDARNSRMALHNLWVNGELNNMSKRLGDLRAMEPAEAGIWARYEHNKLEKGEDTSLKYNLFQVGYDKAFAGSNGTTYRGVAVSYAKGTGDYEIGDGDLKETALSLYQTYTGKDGRYYDVVLKGGKLMNNYDLTQTSNPSSADYNTWGYSISGEIGKRIYHGNGVYIEPQAELILGRIKGSDYTTSSGMNVDVDAQDTAITRLGVAIGKEIKGTGSYYFKASYYHDFGSGLTLTASDDNTNPFTYGEDAAKNWCIFTLGGTIKAGSNCNIFGEFSKFTGQLTNNLQYNIGARWKI
jgi:outer membrane autotransporter protein